jgi:hypothetical protein
MSRTCITVVAFALICGSGCGDEEIEIPDTCNGGIDLCDRAFDEVAYATTHNAMSNADEGWGAPNQQHGITRQLEDGVRGLMLDTHYYEDEPVLCHNVCQIGSLPLADGLAEIASFLAANRGEVVTIIFESYISPPDTEQAFIDSGLIDFVYTEQSAGEPWPTLRALVDADTRLVVFTDDGGGTYPWYLGVWDHSWEVPFSARQPEDLSCDPNRGDPANELFIFNHFLTQTTGGADLAEMINYDPFFSDRVDDCRAANDGAFPNFLTVDFYDIGDVFAVVDALNTP